MTRSIQELLTIDSLRLGLQDIYKLLVYEYESEFPDRFSTLLAHFHEYLGNVLSSYPSQKSSKLLNGICSVDLKLGVLRVSPEISKKYKEGVATGNASLLQEGCTELKLIIDELHPCLRNCGFRGFIHRESSPGVKPHFENLPGINENDVGLHFYFGTSYEDYTTHANKTVRDMNWGLWGDTNPSIRRVLAYKFSSDIFRKPTSQT